MWEPVEVYEWVGDIPLDGAQVDHVWRMEVWRMDHPTSPLLRTACGLYIWDEERPACLLWDEDLVWRTRQKFWQQYDETGAFPVFTNAKGAYMPINETRDVAVTLEADTMAPLFIPLVDLGAGDIIIPNQCTLTLTGVPSPLEVAVMLCTPGTVLGDPGDAVLQVGDAFNVVADQPCVLEGNVPPLAQGGVLGLHVPVQTLTTGAKVEGVLSLVR